MTSLVFGTFKVKEGLAYLRVMAERPRLLVLDLLESYARERNIDVRLERRLDLSRWFCVLSGPAGQGFVRGTGGTAREAIRDALKLAGVEDSSGLMPRHRLRIPHSNAGHAKERPMIWSDDDPRPALQIGDIVTADGVDYIVTALETSAEDGRLRVASYEVERS